MASLAGMVITLPQGGSGKLKGMADVSRLLRGLFLPLKAFLQSPAKKFVVLIHSREDTETLGRLLAEGMLGLFLSAAQEYPSVQFRTLEIDRDTDLRAALRGALDRGYPAVEMIHRDGRVFTSEGQLAPSVFRDSVKSESESRRRCSHVRGRNRDQRPPGPRPCAFHTPPGLSGEDTSRYRRHIPQSRNPDMRLPMRTLSSPEHRRLLGH